MKNVTIMATLLHDPKTVFDVVSDNEHTAWRSDVTKIVTTGKDTFEEYAPNGTVTKFTIVKKEPYERYEFKMENDKFTGSWLGLFIGLSDGSTQLVFTEHIEMKKPLFRILVHLVPILKKMQKNYINDLKKYLDEIDPPTE